MYRIILFNRGCRYHGCIANYPKLLWNKATLHVSLWNLWFRNLDRTEWFNLSLMMSGPSIERSEAGEWDHLKYHAVACRRWCWYWAWSLNSSSHGPLHMGAPSKLLWASSQGDNGFHPWDRQPGEVLPLVMTRHATFCSPRESQSPSQVPGEGRQTPGNERKGSGTACGTRNITRTILKMQSAT